LRIRLSGHAYNEAGVRSFSQFHTAAYAKPPTS
jgi:hypothetical protein